MKDKLRELAERLAARIGSQPSTTISSKEVCELLSILDAEGDDGAVGWISPEALAALKETHNQMHAEYVINLPNEKQSVPIFTHPARSGVVSVTPLLVDTLCNAAFGHDDYGYEAQDRIRAIPEAIDAAMQESGDRRTPERPE